MRQTLDELRNTFVSLWHGAAALRDEDWRIYSPGEQGESEGRLRAFVDLLSVDARCARDAGVAGRDAQDRLLAGFIAFVCPTLGWDRRSLEGLLEEFPPAMDQFRLEARRFDPSLSAADIYQGARNAITMLCLQRLLGVAVGVTPAVLGYSLLYPYTDNFLDDASIGKAAKAAFVARFGDRLAGRRVDPADRLEAHVFGLVESIEGQYPRDRYPQVFDALLAIHAAQLRSVALLASPTPRDVIEIAVEKGGTSVLADGYLVAGTLTRAQAECLYGLGVFLQLRDDLEDLADDRRRKQATVFSSLRWYRRLDDPTMRTLAIGRAVLDRLETFEAPSARLVRDLMTKSLLLTITDAAASAARRYSRSFREMLERHSPFRFAFLIEQRRRVSRAQGSFTGMLEAWVAPGAPGLKTPGPQEREGSGLGLPEREMWAPGLQAGPPARQPRWGAETRGVPHLWTRGTRTFRPGAPAQS
jgi:hypothetical protein